MRKAATFEWLSGSFASERVSRRLPSLPGSGLVNVTFVVRSTAATSGLAYFASWPGSCWRPGNWIWQESCGRRRLPSRITERWQQRSRCLRIGCPRWRNGKNGARLDLKLCDTQEQKVPVCSGQDACEALGAQQAPARNPPCGDFMRNKPELSVPVCQTTCFACHRGN
jgi:hypothetical protein